MSRKYKFLIIRFSSFGDIAQCFSIISGIHHHYPEAEIHWACRSDFRDLLSLFPSLDRIWSFDRQSGLAGLVKFCIDLKKEDFDYIYDAHSNLRSYLVSAFLAPFWRRFFPFKKVFFLRRKKQRGKRFLLFKLRINLFPRPFRGMISFQQPLYKWGISHFPHTQSNPCAFPGPVKQEINQAVRHFIRDKSAIVLVPSAAWKMKRWPQDHWKKLIRRMPERYFIILGGPQDSFCQIYQDMYPERVLNLAGKLSLSTSCAVIAQCCLLISSDTGLLHMGDLMGTKAIALIGPTAFGFPTGPSITICEIEMKCRPCSKDGSGKCSQMIWQKCMVDISPEMVADQAKKSLLE